MVVSRTEVSRVQLLQGIVAEILTQMKVPSKTIPARRVNPPLTGAPPAFGTGTGSGPEVAPVTFADAAHGIPAFANGRDHLASELSPATSQCFVQGDEIRAYARFTLCQLAFALVEILLGL
jgi:hypothetical protein